MRILIAVLLGLGTTCAAGQSFRSIDGSDPSSAAVSSATADQPLLRLAAPAYDDGTSAPRGGEPGTLPSARAVSNAIMVQTGPVTNTVGASDWLWQWGQFLDHDLVLTDAADPPVPFDIPVPTGDAYFDPGSTGTATIGLNRSAGIFQDGVLEQVNKITAFIDGSNIYGSDAARANDLRSFDGTGSLRSSLSADGGEVLLPYNVNGLPNAGGPSPSMYVAGDVRANEQMGLTAVHTLFLREHNRVAALLKTRLDLGDAQLVDARDAAIAHPDNGIDNEGDFLYQAARKVVGAELQKITYDEFLPVLLGTDPLSPFTGYDANVMPGISNEFATAAYRVGHTMLPTSLLRMGDGGIPDAAGDMSLKDAFFNPGEVHEHGIDALLMGLASQYAQDVDTALVDDVRNFLFGPPGSGGFDLASLNIQRGRDHGLPGLNAFREEVLGAGTGYLSFEDLTGGDAALAAAFAEVYDSIEDVDLWIGGLAEPHVNGGMVGETFATILIDQFTRTRDGDPFFYLNPLELADLLMLDPDFLELTTLAGIITRNSSMTWIQDNVFLAWGYASVTEPGTLLLLAIGIAGVSLPRKRIDRRRGRGPYPSASNA